MNFDFTEEQLALREALSKLLARSAHFDARKEQLRAGRTHAPALWRQLAELGALGVALPEEHEGAGGSAVDTMVVCEQLGRFLVLEPYLATAVVAAGAVAHAGRDEQKRSLLPAIASGQQLLALAHGERDARYELAHVTTKARRDGDFFVLDGAKHVVLGGDVAGTMIVSARLGDASDVRTNLALFLVPADAGGLERRSYRMQDNLGAADLTLEAVRVPASAALGPLDRGLEVVEHATALGIAAACAEAVGVMTVLIELTTEYVKTRKQFGVPIGSFQALQHRLADMLMKLEQARSMTYLAASTLAGPAPTSAAERDAMRRTLSAAKAMVGQCGRAVGQGAIQLHGGIGMTDEAQVSHYFKRVTTLDLTFGDADHHVAQVSDLMARD